MKVLLAEDDIRFGKNLYRLLEQENYIVDWYQDGILTEEGYNSGNYDVMLLDINLPKKSGFSILDDSKIHKTPIIVLTSLSSVPDRIKGLNKGADDYLGKPFDFLELKARMLSVIRRNKNLGSLVLEHQDLKINIDANLVYFKGEVIKIPRKELLILKALMLKKGSTVNRAPLLEKIYSANHYIESNVLEAHIYNLRKILGKDYITTVHGIGYKIG